MSKDTPGTRMEPRRVRDVYRFLRFRSEARCSGEVLVDTVARRRVRLRHLAVTQTLTLQQASNMATTTTTEQPTYPYVARWNDKVVLRTTERYTREQCAELNLLLEKWTERVAKEVSRPFSSPEIDYEYELPPASDEN